MADDGALLRDYSEHGSEPAFAELVRRHLNLVYSVALRQTGGDSHRAQDISQSVFADLARKAGALSSRSSLAGWLYIAAHRAAAKLRRSEGRRQAREKKAQMMQELSSHESSPEWERLRPVLDEALQQLSERDREAVLLRFFEGCAFAEIGGKLRLSQDASRMRVDRALERLQTLLSRRGVTSTGAALALLLANQAVVAAPEGLAAAVGASALAAPAGAGAIGALIQFMSTTKLQIGIAAAILAAGAFTAVKEARANQELGTEIAQLTQSADALPQLRSNYVRLRKTESDLQAAVAAADEEQSSTSAAKAANTLQAGQRHVPIDSVAAALAKGPLFEIGDLDQKPIAIDMTTVRFPAALRHAGLKGEARFDFIVATDGGVVGAKVISSSSPEVGEAALNALSQWVFQPGEKAGQPVNVEVDPENWTGRIVSPKSKKERSTCQRRDVCMPVS